MSFITGNLKQTATYWAPTTLNSFGKPTFVAPVTISCRWEDKEVKFYDAQGDERVSKSIVYLASDVLNTGYLYLGTSTESSPHGVVGTLEIKGFKKTPNIKGTLFERKAFL